MTPKAYTSEARVAYRGGGAARPHLITRKFKILSSQRVSFRTVVQTRGHQTYQASPALQTVMKVSVYVQVPAVHSTEQ